MNKKIQLIEQSQLKKDVPQFKVGDVVVVHQRIVEGEKSRIQLFEGVVIKRRGSSIFETASRIARRAACRMLI